MLTRTRVREGNFWASPLLAQRKEKEKKLREKKERAAPLRRDPKDKARQKRERITFARENKTQTVMDKNTVTSLADSGCSLIVRSTPFCINELRNMAKAALQTSATLTIVVEDNLTPKDIQLITAEAPHNIQFDFTRCNL